MILYELFNPLTAIRSKSVRRLPRPERPNRSTSPHGHKVQTRPCRRCISDPFLIFLVTNLPVFRVCDTNSRQICNTLNVSSVFLMHTLFNLIQTSSKLGKSVKIRLEFRKRSQSETVMVACLRRRITCFHNRQPIKNAELGIFRTVSRGITKYGS